MQGTQDTVTEGRVARIAQGGLDPEEASQLLGQIFDTEGYFNILCGYSEAQQQRYIDGLYEAFGSLPLDSPMRQRCFRALRKAGAETGLLPTSYCIPFQLEKQDELPNAAGGFSEVWKTNGPAGVTYALKVLRVTKEDNFPEIKKRFCKEVFVAKQVINDNVLAIEGVQMTDTLKPSIVSEWMEHGNMHTYLKSNQIADRAEFLLGVTRGLCYLHSIDVVHGDLKSSNILIDPNGNPRLTDFGLSSITRNTFSFHASTATGRGSTRWRAPELLALSLKAKELEKLKDARPTMKSDVYSLAMVVIEIFTGNHPFDSYTDEQVILLLAQDSRPDKPAHGQFTSQMWSLTKKCWNKDAKKRPDIQDVLRKLDSGNENNRFRLPWGALFGSRISLPFGERSDTIRES